MEPLTRRAPCAAALLALGGCATTVGPDGAGSAREEARRFTTGAFRVAAEGPCARLSVHALGERRVLVYGDTGYDLAGWLPGDEVPAAQSLAVLTPQGAARDPRLLEGLPVDARGYVPGELSLGGHDDTSGWLVRGATRYAPGGHGVLFAREAQGFTWGKRGWARAEGSPVERPPDARHLPALPATTCGEGRTFLPLASATTRGGVLVAGRCDDARVPNPPEAAVWVLHGRPGAVAWQAREVPGTQNLDGIVNVALAARGDDDATLVAWEPFVPLERRQSFAARFDGVRWAPWEVEVRGGLLDVAYESSGEVVLTNGAGAFRLDREGRARALPLPAPRFTRGGTLADLYVRGVETLGDELWIEATHRVWLDRDRPAVWASVVFTNAQVPRTVYCDAREPADRALSEVE